MWKYLKARFLWNLARYTDLKKPAHVDLELSTKCPLRCAFCYRNEVEFEKKNIDHALAERVLLQAEFYGIPSIKYNWRGEALENPLELYWALNSFPSFYTMLNTALPRVNDLRIIDDLAKYVDDLKISIDSADRIIYCTVRKGMNPKGFKVLMSNVEALAGLRKKYGKAKLIISRRTSTLTESETDEQFKKAFKGVKFDIKPAIQRNNENIYQMPPIGKGFTYSNRKYCGQPSRRLVIDVDGNVWACCVAYKGQDELLLGNLDDNNLDEIWNGEKRKKLVKDLKNGILNGACAECTSSDVI